MANTSRHTAPWIFWPLAALWDLLAFVLSLTGRLIGVVLSIVLMVVGIVLTLTFVGAVIGVPIIVFGFLLLIRSIF